MKNSYKSLLVSFLILSFTFTPGSLQAAQKIDSQRNKLWDITKKLRQKRSKLAKIKTRQKSTLRNLAVLNRHIKSTQYEVSYANLLLKKTEGQIVQHQQDLIDLSEAYTMQKNIFKHRVREIYKQNNLGYLLLFFSAKTTGDLLNKSVYFEKILVADVELIKKLRQQQQNIIEMETKLLDRQAELQEIKSYFSKRKSKYKRQRVAQNKIYKQIARKRALYEKQIRELEKNSKEIESMIVNLVSSGKGSKIRGSGKFIWPLKGRITSKYGHRRHPIFRKVRFHSGLDIARRSGTPIKAADSGKVVSAGWWGGYGRATIIDHGNGYSTVYAHQSKILVKKGQQVKKGQTIGKVGSTGYSTGPHLHFEIRKNGATQNPLRFL